MSKNKNEKKQAKQPNEEFKMESSKEKLEKALYDLKAGSEKFVKK